MDHLATVPDLLWTPDDGTPVVDEIGELVVTAPMPSMPVRLWNDPDGSRYADTYFSTFPGVWRHGDWLTITSRRTTIVHGRSDSAINRPDVLAFFVELGRRYRAGHTGQAGAR